MFDFVAHNNKCVAAWEISLLHEYRQNWLETVCIPGCNNYILGRVMHWEATSVKGTGDTHFSIAIIYSVREMCPFWWGFWPQNLFFSVRVNSSSLLPGFSSHDKDLTTWGVCLMNMWEPGRCRTGSFGLYLFVLTCWTWGLILIYLEPRTLDPDAVSFKPSYSNNLHPQLSFTSPRGYESLPYRLLRGRTLSR